MGVAVQRLVVFVDYQNVYHLARRAFRLENGPSTSGQVNPDRLGVLIEARRNMTFKGTANECELKEVRIYRGMPDGAMDAKGHGATSRQIAHWERFPDVKAFTHPIAYPYGWENEWDRARIKRGGDKPREKGIDVQLAVDLVLGAVENHYDVAVVFSGDSDLLPAIRAAMKLGKHIEVAAWDPPDSWATRIPARDLPPRPDGKPMKLWCHFFKAEDFRFARDNTDYTQP